MAFSSVLNDKYIRYAQLRQARETNDSLYHSNIITHDQWSISHRNIVAEMGDVLEEITGRGRQMIEDQS